MPNYYTQAIKEAIAQANSELVILNTLELSSGVSSSEVTKIDVCFILDLSGSMGSAIVWLKTNLPTLFTTLQNTFSQVRIALITYGQTSNIGNPELQSGFVTDTSGIVTILDGLSASGGREPGFDAIKLATDSLNWVNSNYGVSRNIVMITDEDSEDSGQTATEETALAAMQGLGIRLNQTYNESTSRALKRMQDATEGDYISISDESTFVSDTVEALQNVIVVDPDLEPIYMVDARVPYTVTLENDVEVEMEPVPIKMSFPGQSSQGAQELMFAIGNVDQRIGKWINAIKKYEAPVIVRYRPYLENDLTAPAMDPPMKLEVSDVTRNSLQVTARAGVADIINLVFLRELYSRRRFPSLGNT